MDSITEELGSLSLFDEYGKNVTMSTMWEQQPAVLVFVRHFG